MESTRNVTFNRRKGWVVITILLSCFLLLYWFFKNKNEMSTTSVKGILVDSATGAPVADAYIMITGGDEHPDIASQSGDDGSFFLEGVHVPGTYTLQIRRGDSSKTVTVNVDNKGKVLSIPF